MTEQKTPQIDVPPGKPVTRNLIFFAFNLELFIPLTFDLSALSFELISRNADHQTLNTKYQARSFLYFELFSRPTRQLSRFAGEGLQSTAIPVRRALSGHRWESTESHLAGLSAGQPGS